jgi:hypothetical protein
VRLNATGKRLLAKHGSLKVKLTLTQSGKTIRSTTVTFKKKKAKAKRRTGPLGPAGRGPSGPDANMRSCH